MLTQPWYGRPMKTTVHRTFNLTIRFALGELLSLPGDPPAGSCRCWQRRTRRRKPPGRRKSPTTDPPTHPTDPPTHPPTPPTPPHPTPPHPPTHPPTHDYLHRLSRLPGQCRINVRLQHLKDPVLLQTRLCAVFSCFSSAGNLFKERSANVLLAKDVLKLHDRQGGPPAQQFMRMKDKCPRTALASNLACILPKA